MPQLRRWAAIAAFLLAVVAAAMAPLRGRANSTSSIVNDTFRGSPTHYEGSPLTELVLTERELVFLRDFPGVSAASQTAGARSSCDG